MKFFLAFFGIGFVLFGTFSGLLNWFLTEFYLQTVDWEGPMMIVNQAAWILNILGMGLGSVFIGIAAMVKSAN